MSFWRKRDTSGSRRNIRLWVSRFRQFGLGFCALGLCLWISFYAWKSGIFSAFGDWAHDRTMIVTAAAGFRVGEILVTGRDRVPQQEILARLNVKQGAPIFDIPIDQAQQALASIPWVHHAAVFRRLPGTVVVAISERRPAALWQYQKKLSVIDIDGRELTSSDIESYRGLPLVVGEDAPQHAAAMLGLLRAEPEIAALFSAAVRVGGRRWDLHLRNGTVVKLPGEDAELALRRLALRQKENGLLDKNIAAVDLRIPDKFVIEPAARPDRKASASTQEGKKG